MCIISVLTEIGLRAVERAVRWDNNLCFNFPSNYDVYFFFILAPPRFTRTPVDQTGVSGGVASFICQATGDPRPKIVWNKKGKKVSNQRFEVLGPLFCFSGGRRYLLEFWSVCYLFYSDTDDHWDVSFFMLFGMEKFTLSGSDFFKKRIWWFIRQLSSLYQGSNSVVNIHL